MLGETRINESESESDDTALWTQDSNSSPDGLRPSTLPRGHRGSRQYWIFTSSMSKREQNCFFSLKLEGQSGAQTRDLPTFQTGSFNHCTRAPPRPKPRRHNTMHIRWLNIRAVASTVRKRWSKIFVCWLDNRRLYFCIWHPITATRPAVNCKWPELLSVSCRFGGPCQTTHLRCWPSIKSTLAHRLVFAGLGSLHWMEDNHTAVQSKKRQYLLTLQVSRYCLLALQRNIMACSTCHLASWTVKIWCLHDRLHVMSPPLEDEQPVTFDSDNSRCKNRKAMMSTTVGPTGGQKRGYRHIQTVHHRGCTVRALLCTLANVSVSTLLSPSGRPYCSAKPKWF